MLTNRHRRAILSEDDYRDKLRALGFNDEGKFIPDSVPVAPPLGYKRQPSMVEIVRNMVRSEKLAEEARNAGAETFEESEDFDIDDEPEDLRSGWETEFDPPLDEIQRAVEEERAAQLISAGANPTAVKAHTEPEAAPVPQEPNDPKPRSTGS